MCTFFAYKSCIKIMMYGLLIPMNPCFLCIYTYISGFQVFQQRRKPHLILYFTSPTFENNVSIKRGYYSLICYSTSNVVIYRSNSLKDPASKAYAQVFSPHHGWAIRKAVAAGMYALPTKAQLLNKLNEDGEFYLSAWFFSPLICTLAKSTYVFHSCIF